MNAIGWIQFSPLHLCGGECSGFLTVDPSSLRNNGTRDKDNPNLWIEMGTSQKFQKSISRKTACKSTLEPHEFSSAHRTLQAEVLPLSPENSFKTFNIVRVRPRPPPATSSRPNGCPSSNRGHRGAEVAPSSILQFW